MAAEKSFAVELPGVGPKDRPPMAQASPLTFSTKGRIGVLKVTSFPGAVGFDLLRGVQSALASFAEVKMRSAHHGFAFQLRRRAIIRASDELDGA